MQLVVDLVTWIKYAAQRGTGSGWLDGRNGRSNGAKWKAGKCMPES